MCLVCLFGLFVFDCCYSLLVMRVFVFCECLRVLSIYFFDLSVADSACLFAIYICFRILLAFVFDCGWLCLFVCDCVVCLYMCCLVSIVLLSCDYGCLMLVVFVCFCCLFLFVC